MTSKTLRHATDQFSHGPSDVLIIFARPIRGKRLTWRRWIEAQCAVLSLSFLWNPLLADASPTASTETLLHLNTNSPSLGLISGADSTLFISRRRRADSGELDTSSELLANTATELQDFLRIGSTPSSKEDIIDTLISGNSDESDRLSLESKEKSTLETTAEIRATQATFGGKETSMESFDSASAENAPDTQHTATRLVKQSDMQPEASGGHGHHHEKGGGREHKHNHHKEKGKKEEKGYKSSHTYKKGDKGHHDKEGHKKKYKDEKGKKEKHEEGAGHYGEHKQAEKGKKKAHYDEEGHHKKGHSTKGEHNVHKKDEYHKKHEFYDEHHEGGEHEKHGGYHGEHKNKHAKKYKKGHHDSSHKSKHKSKKGHHKKGKKHKMKKGHKDEGGHSEKYGHKKDYKKSSGEDKGKKWGYKKTKKE